MILVVVLTLIDDDRKPGKPRTSPFRISDKMLGRNVSDHEPTPAEKRRRRVRAR